MRAFMPCSCLVLSLLPAQQTSRPEWRPTRSHVLVGEDAAVRVQWIEDEVRLREMLVDKKPLPACGDVDFATHLVLSVVRPVPRGQRLCWLGSDKPEGLLRVRIGAQPWRAEVDGKAEQPAEPPRSCGALFVVPRTERKVAVDVVEAGRSTRVVILPPPADPFRVELAPVQRCRDLAKTDWREGPAVMRAADAAQLRRLYRKLGKASSEIPADFVDFDTHVVVAVATGTARAFPGLRFSTATEEGVDVLQVTEWSPSGVLVDERAPVLVLKLPRRQRQLAVVLRRQCGPGPGSEETLAVLPPLR
jgi:hypothetical protein